MANLLELENFIDGRFEACSRHVDSYNPATGEVHLKVPDSGEGEVQLAVEAAQRAFKKYVDSESLISWHNLCRCYTGQGIVSLMLHTAWT